ncbi:hypothetical protein [Sandaracinus amylolyticus]|nr:hypothetical protein [Sandaracinus amylolyticus]UJR84085.1 Hypothetical protein I5071_61560 [Sandaracinus amylolyticus]
MRIVRLVALPALVAIGGCAAEPYEPRVCDEARSGEVCGPPF